MVFYSLFLYVSFSGGLKPPLSMFYLQKTWRRRWTCLSQIGWFKFGAFLKPSAFSHLSHSLPTMISKRLSGRWKRLQYSWPGFKSQVLHISLLFFNPISYAASVVMYTMLHHHPDVHVLSEIRSMAKNQRAPYTPVNMPHNAWKSQRIWILMGQALPSKPPYWGYPPMVCHSFYFSYVLFNLLFYFLDCLI